VQPTSFSIGRLYESIPGECDLKKLLVKLHSELDLEWFVQGASETPYPNGFLMDMTTYFMNKSTKSFDE
jgi:hypothetical protein